MKKKTKSKENKNAIVQEKNPQPSIKTTKQKVDPTRARETQYHSLAIVKTFLDQNYEKISKDPTKFEDDFFPPNNISLFSTKKELNDYQPSKFPHFLRTNPDNKFYSQYCIRDKDKYDWRSLKDVYTDFKDLNVLRLTSDLTVDVIQGDLGDSYFLSALTMLAKDPKRLEKIISPEAKITQSGVYQAKVYIHGDPVDVCVDDYFPVIDYENDDEKEKKEPEIAFARINENSQNIWPLILEKVWAKCNLSYEDIVSGNAGEAFEFLTPAPVDTFYNNALSDKLFDLIKDALDKNYIVACDISDAQNTNLLHLARLGVVTNHAYQVIDAKTLKGPVANRDINLLKIENRWGTNKWYGNINDLTKNWSKELKDQAKSMKININNNKDKKTYWMSYEDYISFYTTTHICHINTDYHFESKKFYVHHENPFNIVKVEIDQNDQGYFIINLKNKRIYEALKGLSTYENPFCSIIVFKEDNNGYYSFVGSDCGKQNRFYVKCNNLTKGTYFVAVSFPKEKTFFQLKETFPVREFKKMAFRVGLYSKVPKGKVKIEPTDNVNQVSCLSSFCNEIVKNLAEANKDKYYFEKDSEKPSFRVINFDSSNCGFGYIYYENNLAAYIRERLKITDLSNVVIVPMLRNGQKTDLEESVSKTKIPENEDEEEIEYEEPNTKIAIMNLVAEENLESSSEIITEPNNKNSISVNNSPIVQFNIAPDSKCLIFLQKTGNTASIDFSSEICIDYLPVALITDSRFKSKKFRLQYNNKPVEIYEIITEHSTGVLFQYKNKTTNIVCSIKASFDKLDNLKVCLINADKIVDKNDDNSERDENLNYASLHVKPGESKFFALRSLNAFRNFSYNSMVDYRFCKTVKDKEI